MPELKAMIEDSVSQKYSIVVGNGRSGTNWLLSMLNASPFTHCRNEPQEIAESPFHDLPDIHQMRQNPDLMAEKWDYFAAWTGKHMGERDHRITAPKIFVHTISQKSGVAYWPVRPKIRTALKLILPDLRRGEWPIPWWLGHRDHLENTHAIFKINDLRAWYVRWLLKHRPQRRIIHIARHPGGQLNSGINRFFSNLDGHTLEKERQLYTDILKTAIALEPHWIDILGDPDEMELIEAVAWFWRYNNEEIYKAGNGCKNYLFITYEELAKAPLEYARQVYEFCDLSWNDDIEALINKGLTLSMWGKLDKKSNEVSKTWKNKLEARYQTLASSMLKDSILERYWLHESER